MMIQDPIGDTIYKRSDENRGIILFNTTVPGVYTFLFANHDATNEQQEVGVTFALRTFEETQEEPMAYDMKWVGNDMIRVVRGNEVGEDILIEAETKEIAGNEEVSEVRK